MQLQEHILGEVFCPVPVRQHAQRQAVYRTLMFANQSSEGRRFSGGRSR